MNLQIFKFYGIRKKLIFCFIITISLLAITSLLSYRNAKVVLTNTNEIINDYIYLNNINNNVDTMMTELEKYLTSASSEDLHNYYYYYNRLKESGRQIASAEQEANDQLMLEDIENMVDQLMNETDKAIQAKRGKISSKYISYFQRSDEISNYIKTFNSMLLDNKLKNGSEKYEMINKNMSLITYINILVIIVAIFVDIFIAAFYTYRLTKPIAKLSSSAEKIAEGDFNIEIAQSHTGDETDILTNAFIKMVKNIRDYIDELKLHAEVEKKLKEQELQNLKMTTLLKEAELKFLQSQINPHFLFNTLNAASQLAMIEGADRSSEFIENIAQLFRYNLKNIEEQVPLRDEIEYVKNYMQVLKIRFGSRITFFNDIDEDALDIRVPRITIQPIVENAFIHGLQDLEKGGEIYLNVKSYESNIVIEVIDNGKGMATSSINSILCTTTEGSKATKHINGIGMNNVIERLKILFDISNNQDLINIESSLGSGTKVTLIIPRI